MKEPWECLDGASKVLLFIFLAAPRTSPIQGLDRRLHRYHISVDRRLQLLMFLNFLLPQPWLLSGFEFVPLVSFQAST